MKKKPKTRRKSSLLSFIYFASCEIISAQNTQVNNKSIGYLIISVVFINHSVKNSQILIQKRKLIFYVNTDGGEECTSLSNVKHRLLVSVRIYTVMVGKVSGQYKKHNLFSVIIIIII